MYYVTRIILLAICLWILTPHFVHGQKASDIRLYQITVGNKSGFIDRTGKIVIQPIFDGDRYMLSDFSEGLAEFKDMKALPKYPFSKEGFIDSSGRIVIKPQFDVAYDFSNERAQVKIGDLTSFIDKTGKQVIKLGPYQAARSFREGLAAVYSNLEFWFIDIDGKTVIPKQTGLPKDFSEGLACVYLPVDGKLKAGYIDHSGNVVIAPQFDDGFDFSEGLARVKAGEKFGYIDKTGKFVIQPRFRTAYEFSNGRARVSTGENYGYIDKRGAYILAEKYDISSTDFAEGLAAICVLDSCGYMDVNGKWVIMPIFRYASGFRNGLASVQMPNHIGYEGYIDRTGKFIWKPSR